MREDHSVRASEILKARAQALARPVAQRERGAPGRAVRALELVEFQLAQERYALEQRHVREVCPFDSLTPLPCVPPHVMGIVNLRGQILPVLNLKKFFDLPEAGITDLHMIIVLRSGDVEIGLLADVVLGISVIDDAVLQPTLPTLTGIRSQYLKGVGPGQTIVLDARKILEDPRLVVDEEVQA